MTCGLLGLKLVSYLFTYLGSVLKILAEEDPVKRVISSLISVLDKDLTILLTDDLCSISLVSCKHICVVGFMPDLVWSLRCIITQCQVVGPPIEDIDHTFLYGNTGSEYQGYRRVAGRAQ